MPLQPSAFSDPAFHLACCRVKWKQISLQSMLIIPTPIATALQHRKCEECPLLELSLASQIFCLIPWSVIYTGVVWMSLRDQETILSWKHMRNTVLLQRVEFSVWNLNVTRRDRAVMSPMKMDICNTAPARSELLNQQNNLKIFWMPMISKSAQIVWKY